ncbi:serine protease 44-like isoform X2 [Ostrinia furnacalis]|uniref:serine protease 44-like isoform X2 n=1 Tax=Ostrinia furnacalis TaxID=93504 RepID=UPI0010407F2C|nr:serine protease 44-like isoform X2 [Ostrinia furnacalis]
MIRHITCLLIVALAVPSYEQDVPISPCPNVFMYEPLGAEKNRWYGVVNLSTDSTLHGLWLNIVLDGKADILGNWIGDVSTSDNKDFKVENSDMMIHPGPAVAVRFFVQYNILNPTPKLKTIRLNGREICNADIRSPVTPDTNWATPKPTKAPTRPVPDRTTERVVTQRPITERPVTDWAQEHPVYRPPSGGSPNPVDIAGGHDTSNGIKIVDWPPRRPGTTTEADDSQEKGGGGFGGGLPVVFVPGRPTSRPPMFDEGNNNKPQVQCGSVVKQNPKILNPLIVNGVPTYEGQWPWQVALYQTQTVDNKYICGGTLVSERHIVTAAHCVTQKGSNRLTDKNTLTVYLGKHNLRTSVEGVQIRLVSHIHKYPEYNGSSYQMDLAILVLREPVFFTDWVRPVCLWPDSDTSLNTIVGKRGSVVGWGFDETGVATEELSLVEMPVVKTETCIRSYSEFFVQFTSEYTYCAGYRNGTYDERTGRITSTSVCNGDSGGGMVFKINGLWYLRGLVSLSVARQNEYRCDPSHYVVFTDIAKFLPWIKARLSE